jgi:hypothetical protein
MMKLTRTMIILGALLTIGAVAGAAHAQSARSVPPPAQTDPLAQFGGRTIEPTPAPAPADNPCRIPFNKAVSMAGQEPAKIQTVADVAAVNALYLKLPVKDFEDALACVKDTNQRLGSPAAFQALLEVPTGKTVIVTTAERRAIIAFVDPLIVQDSVVNFLDRIVTAHFLDQSDRYRSLVTQYDALADQYNALLQENAEERSELQTVAAAAEASASASAAASAAQESAAEASTPHLSPLQDLLNTLQHIADRPPVKHITCQTNGFDNSSGSVNSYGDVDMGGFINSTTDCTEQ